MTGLRTRTHTLCRSERPPFLHFAAREPTHACLLRPQLALSTYIDATGRLRRALRFTLVCVAPLWALMATSWLLGDGGLSGAAPTMLMVTFALVGSVGVGIMPLSVSVGVELCRAVHGLDVAAAAPLVNGCARLVDRHGCLHQRREPASTLAHPPGVPAQRARAPHARAG